MIPPLAIVQARMGSKRLPGKMLLQLGDHPLIYWAWNAARIAFGEAHTVVAMPASAENDELAETVEGFGGAVFRWKGDENDVLGRFWACANRYRWHPDSVIVRVTPDDPWKSATAMRLVASGERLAVELGGEAFTLAMLDAAEMLYAPGAEEREHITRALFATDPPPCPRGLWTIDTQEDLDRARELVDRHTDQMYAEMDIASLAGAQA